MFASLKNSESNFIGHNIVPKLLCEECSSSLKKESLLQLMIVHVSSLINLLSDSNGTCISCLTPTGQVRRLTGKLTADRLALTADWLAQLVEREVTGSNLGRTNTHGL